MVAWLLLVIMKQYFIVPYCCNIWCVSNFNWHHVYMCVCVCVWVVPVAQSV